MIFSSKCTGTRAIHLMHHVFVLGGNDLGVGDPRPARDEYSCPQINEKRNQMWGSIQPGWARAPCKPVQHRFLCSRPHLQKILDPPHRRSTLETARHATALHLKTGNSPASPPRGLRPPGGPAIPGAAPAPHLAPLLHRQGTGRSLPHNFTIISSPLHLALYFQSNTMLI